jgi:hypothetical protein
MLIKRCFETPLMRRCARAPRRVDDEGCECGINADTPSGQPKSQAEVVGRAAVDARLRFGTCKSAIYLRDQRGEQLIVFSSTEGPAAVSAQPTDWSFVREVAVGQRTARDSKRERPSTIRSPGRERPESHGRPRAGADLSAGPSR